MQKEGAKKDSRIAVSRMKSRVLASSFRSILIMVVIFISIVLLSILVSAKSESTFFKKSPGALDVQVTFLNQDPDPVEPGERVKLRWKVENKGAGALNDVSVSVSEEGPLHLTTKEQKIKEVGSLDSRQIGKDSYAVEWEFDVDEQAVEGDYEVDFRYGMGDASVKLENFTVHVKSRDTVVLLDKVEVIPERTQAGQEARVHVTIANLADSAVDDVRVSVDLKDLPFATVGSAGEKAIKKLLAGESQEIIFQLVVDGTAPSKVHRIPLKVTYANREGKKYETQTNFGLIVDNPPQFIINVDETKVYQSKKKGNVVLSFSNIGKSDINFVVLTLLPSPVYTILSPPTSYLGNLESDDYETAAFDVFVEEGKTKDVKLMVQTTFKDSYNEEYVIEQEIPVAVYSPGEIQRYGLGAEQSNWGVWILIIAILAVVYYKKKGEIHKFIKKVLHG